MKETLSKPFLDRALNCSETYAKSQKVDHLISCTPRVKARARTARFGGKRTNYEATMSPIVYINRTVYKNEVTAQQQQTF